MGTEKSYACSGGSKLIFACSGAADVGAVADHAARQLDRERIGKMFCAAGIGGRVSGILKTTESAEKILAIDGCPLNCVKMGLEEAGFESFLHLQLADLGLEKGRTVVNSESVEKVASRGRDMLRD